MRHNMTGTGITMRYMTHMCRLAAVCVLLFAATPTHADQQVDFSATKHSRERSIVKNLLKEEIKTAKTLSKDPVQIDIALADLNHDGIQEILAYVRQHPYFCGAEGCWFMVFQKDGKNWKNLLQLIIREDIKLSDSSAAGFVDLVVEGASIWRWQGDKYEYFGKLK